ncbi:MAG TPA: aldolase/citrate lyase family protein [Spirochaetia bacterium]|nr:aldolase/citrate lyase family protein [Spirochaetia bacterium]
MAESFRSRLSRGDLFIGTLLTLPSPEIAEIFCASGFDWLFVDIEHGPMDMLDAQRILQAAAYRVPCIVRVPALEEVWIKKALDIGSAGVIVPQVRTVEEAQTSVRLCKYPPTGTRSVGISRAHGYGQNFMEYIAKADQETAVIIQIEHIDAVNNVENILKVPGIDCLFVGPYDLSSSMGKTGLVDDSEVQDAITHVQQCAEDAKVPLGVFGATAEVVTRYIRSGYTLIAASMDTLLVGGAAKSLAHEIKGEARRAT